MSICFLGSGGLGLKVLIEIFNSEEVFFVLTDKKSKNIIDFCVTNNIPFHAGNPRNGRLAPIIEKYKVDLLISVNYLFIIENDLIKWPSKYVINFHGSLLPKYRGRTPHVWAIINNEERTGITAHHVDSGCDTGPIIEQIEIPINKVDTGASILEKFNCIYPDFVLKVIAKAKAGDIQCLSQDETKATYFGKRTPEDGKINWEWQKERIYNWIRAQAKPYPGAFSIYENNKIIINKIEFCDFGFLDSMANGYILRVENNLPIVKTQNGAVKILDIEATEIVNFEKGKMFL